MLTISVKSWFVAVTDQLKYKCLQELASTSFYPKLNLKDGKQVQEDLEKMKQS